MWLVVVVNLAFVAWMIAFTQVDACDGMAGLELDVCQSSLIEAGVVLVVLWAAVDVILGVLYVVTRSRP